MDIKIRILKKKIKILFYKLGYPEFYFFIKDIKTTNQNSYTLNKEIIFLNDQYKSINVLYFILLHEISHILCDEIGHTYKFSQIFQILFNKSLEFKLI